MRLRSQPRRRITRHIRIAVVVESRDRTHKINGDDLAIETQRLVERSWRAADQRVHHHRFANLKRERRAVHEMPHQPVGPGLGHDRTTIGMAYEHDRAVDPVKRLGHILNVVRQ
jgi:hypothetical protein